MDSPPRTYPGMSDAIELDPHQNDAVWMAIENPGVLLNHEVGLGKSFVMAAAIMEKKRLGQIDKPVMVVPNQLLEQTVREFRILYPDARILATDTAGLQGSKTDREAGRRRSPRPVVSRDIVGPAFVQAPGGDDTVERFGQVLVDDTFFVDLELDEDQLRE